MMDLIVFDSEAAALAFSGAVDSALGYPREAHDVGGGVHAPAALSRSLSFYGPPRKHPTRTAWAFPYVDEVAALVAVTPALIAGAVLEARDPTWAPASGPFVQKTPSEQAAIAIAVASEAVDLAIAGLPLARKRDVLRDAAAKL